MPSSTEQKIAAIQAQLEALAVQIAELHRLLSDTQAAVINAQK